MSGRVVDENGGLPGATVQIKGTDKGTTTDVEGNFVITVDSENTILIFRFVGLESKELIISELQNSNEVVLEEQIITGCGIFFVNTKTVSYWSGVFYNPYGISFNKNRYYRLVRNYVEFDLGYSTNLKGNSDYYGKLKTEVLRRNISYKFQQTTFNKSETENRIITHFVESNSTLKFVKAYLSYGIGHQQFMKRGLENDNYQNIGISLGVLKRMKYIGTVSAKSFYWQKYWAWEAEIKKDFNNKIHTAISYRQTAQDFKEINLTLGYIF